MKIPTTLITGFLGTGKTTLINDMIKKRPDLNIGLVLNEFGSAQIESGVVTNAEQSNIMELNNGCMCCIVRTDIYDAIKQLLELRKDINYILVEASGLSNPDQIINTFMSPEFHEYLRLDSIICVVDCYNFKNMNNFITTITQINSSNFIVLTKTELVDKRTVDDIKDILKKINPLVTIYEKTEDIYHKILDKSVLDPTIISNLEKESIHEKDKFEHVFFKTKNLIDFHKFNDYFSKQIKGLIRAKAILRFYDSGELDKKYILQIVGNNKYLTPHEWKEGETKQSGIVVIGQGLEKEKIKEDLNNLTADHAK